MVTLCWILLFLAVVFILAYKRASLPVWSLSVFVYLLLASKFSATGVVLLTLYWLVFAVFAVILNIPQIRRMLISDRGFKLYKKIMPSMSQTEREALEAGTVAWEGEVFSGMPNWKTLLAYPIPRLSKEEQAFIDGPVEKVCGMIDNWEVTHNLLNLDDKTWKFLREHKFFGMIIPKKYGGLEFSALAHSEVMVKLSSVSITAASMVGVPNSLGPAELLLEYGTEEQKDHYLPRLARGDDIPCFALTSPYAGSDAASMLDHGVVCEKTVEGKKTLGILLNWDKRYITLAPIATLLGLAFKLYDPKHLLGDKEDIGITCALIPTNTPGVTTGRRHFPLNSGFPNGPTQGKDVFIPVDWIIGGPTMAGSGWRMLVERLAVGRAISLPSNVVGGAKIAVYAGGAYSRIRRQFNMPIGKFEGVQEALARIVGYTYMMDALRKFAVHSIDRGEKPAVPSAIAKYHNTEMGRRVVNDSMDIHGGKGICLGPRNYLGRGYQETPVAITVEGANILTRSLIIFGQGAVRCHPYVFREMEAGLTNDAAEFDKALFGHIGYTFSNMVRSLLLGLSRGYLAGAPKGPTRRYYQKLSRFSAGFAFTADICMLALGADLKRRERLSARLGDVLSYLYIGSAVLKEFEDQGRPMEDLPIVQWAMQTILFKAQMGLYGVFRNLPNRFLAQLLRIFVFPLGRVVHRPSDRLGNKIAELIISPTETRERLSKGAFIQDTNHNYIAKIELALHKVIAAEEFEKILDKAERKGSVKGFSLEEKLKSAVKAGVLSKDQAALVSDASRARKEIIDVDDFDPADLMRTKPKG